MPYALEGRIFTDEVEGGIEISEEQYGEAVLGMTSGKVVTVAGGFAVIDPPQPEPEPKPEPPTLAEAKTAAKAWIDQQAEMARRKYITPGSGQAMTYMQKAGEAARYLAVVAKGDEPVAADYPLLGAEVSITAPTLAEVADIVNDAFTQWQVIGGMIESARLGAKAAIDQAETSEAVDGAANAVTWP